MWTPPSVAIFSILVVVTIGSRTHSMTTLKCKEKYAVADAVWTSSFSCYLRSPQGVRRSIIILPRMYIDVPSFWVRDSQGHVCNVLRFQMFVIRNVCFVMFVYVNRTSTEMYGFVKTFHWSVYKNTFYTTAKHNITITENKHTNRKKGIR